ncbi:PREDICTED: dual specificity protein kinase splA-like [Rhagoletis zephyria]|uniref:dual specificity protein kinase splA-like n=1 Tax=Rhagoletis zephyria TaxID=28612 RepID=UPI0008119AD2|nr:PREDICTED: dual specificity protein kinase splA-like [Rhagoletis zephyria]
MSSSSNSSNTPPPASSSPSSSSTSSSSSSSSSVLANAGTKGNSPSLLPINDALLNYIPISECYSGAKPEESSGTSPPPPRPPKPRALQLAGKSQSSLALYPADNVVNNSSSNSPVNGNFTNGQLPPHLQKLATLMLMNGYGTTTGGRMRSPASPLQYSKSMAMTAGGNVLAPPVLVNDQRPAMTAAGGNSFYGLNGGKGSSAGSLSLPPHNHNYEFCNANVVVGPNGTAFVEVPPPVVNRSLKPHRRSASGRTSSMDSTSPFGSQATRHTLPRPPQFSSYPNRGEDGRKSFNTTHSAHNQQNIGHPNNSHHSNTLSFSHQFGFEKNKKLSPFSSNNNSHHFSNLSHLDTQESSEIQYLDLDLECPNAESTHSQSPKEGGASAFSGGNGGQSDTSQLVSTHSTTTTTNNNNTATHNNFYNGGSGTGQSLTTWNIPPSSTSNFDPFTSTSSGSSLHHNNNNNNVSTPNANHVKGNASSASTTEAMIALIGKDNTNTVYKQVDFVKTKAFNKMRVDMDRTGYRNGNSNANGANASATNSASNATSNS